MNLLKKLQTALSKVNGNTITMEDQGYKEYFCPVCKERVYEEQYNHTKKCCFECWYEETDHTRYDDGDAPEVSNDNQ